jgi:hypothetical protein
VLHIQSVSVALVIQHAKSGCHIILSSVARVAILYFSTLSHKYHDFLEMLLQYEMCVLIFSKNFPGTFLIVRRIQRDIIKNINMSSRKIPLIFIGF